MFYSHFKMEYMILFLLISNLDLPLTLTSVINTYGPPIIKFFLISYSSTTFISDILILQLIHLFTKYVKLLLLLKVRILILGNILTFLVWPFYVKHIDHIELNFSFLWFLYAINRFKIINMMNFSGRKNRPWHIQYLLFIIFWVALWKTQYCKCFWFYFSHKSTYNKNGVTFLYSSKKSCFVNMVFDVDPTEIFRA